MLASSLCSAALKWNMCSLPLMPFFLSLGLDLKCAEYLYYTSVHNLMLTNLFAGNYILFSDFFLYIFFSAMPYSLRFKKKENC